MCQRAQEADADEPLKPAAHTWLDLPRRKLDEAVFATYGWNPDISDERLLANPLDRNLQRASLSKA